MHGLTDALHQPRCRAGREYLRCSRCPQRRGLGRRPRPISNETRKHTDGGFAVRWSCVPATKDFRPSCAAWRVRQYEFLNALPESAGQQLGELAQDRSNLTVDRVGQPQISCKLSDKPSAWPELRCPVMHTCMWRKMRRRGTNTIGLRPLPSSSRSRPTLLSRRRVLIFQVGVTHDVYNTAR